MITWPSKDDPSMRMSIDAVSDTSRGNESEAFRSQGAQVSFFSDGRLMGRDQCCFHFAGHSSVGLTDLHGTLDHLDWEVSVAAWYQSVWRAVCQSCHDILQKPGAKTMNKRLRIGLESLRQNLWREHGNSTKSKIAHIDQHNGYGC